MPAYTQAGPIPPALTTAKTIFVSNAGADSGLFPEPFSGDPDRAYTEFYAALKATGDFTWSPIPRMPTSSSSSAFRPLRPREPNKQKGAADPRPMFRLVIYDRKIPLHPLDRDPVHRTRLPAKDP